MVPIIPPYPRCLSNNRTLHVNPDLALSPPLLRLMLVIITARLHVSTTEGFPSQTRQLATFRMLRDTDQVGTGQVNHLFAIGAEGVGESRNQQLA
jgi:hypothetical protein